MSERLSHPIFCPVVIVIVVSFCYCLLTLTLHISLPLPHSVCVGVCWEGTQITLPPFYLIYWGRDVQPNLESSSEAGLVSAFVHGISSKAGITVWLSCLPCIYVDSWSSDLQSS